MKQEQKLKIDLDKENMPQHVGIILDGNRRFAKKLMLEPWKGHELGADKIKQVFEWVKDIGVKELTLYCFSLENFDRPKREFDFLIKTFKKEFKRLKKDSQVHEEKIKIKFVGQIELFDQELQESIKDVENATKNYDNYTVNFALAYGGRQEIIHAIKELSESGDAITEENLKKRLWLTSDPDLIIRTGGDRRTSNFLPWQSVYSEWIFLDKTWPEFEYEDWVNCINDFMERERRFGK
ncbi:di-trans,poly-cis-decaprenylcistransferase [Candidatus Pacearchaeota archaeon]|nr:di-trans,poly-cis-decaprenylcistransferase [Candidatus Pacearchaeota archaeon]